jgi:hypothetical protein
MAEAASVETESHIDLRRMPFSHRHVLEGTYVYDRERDVGGAIRHPDGTCDESTCRIEESGEKPGNWRSPEFCDCEIPHNQPTEDKRAGPRSPEHGIHEQHAGELSTAASSFTNAAL